MLAEALKTKAVSLQRVSSFSAAQGDPLITVGLAAGEGPAASVLKSAKIAPPEGREGLLIQRSQMNGKNVLLLCGSDDRGLMYALLDTAERIGWLSDGEDLFRNVRDTREKPYCPERAVSIYTMHRAYFEQRFFNEDYWARYFDTLAKNRFNSFVLIFGYENGGYFAPPYPYFFDVEGFPEVRVVGWSREKQGRYLRALNRLIVMAHERGLAVTIGLWDHIYRGGVQSGGMRDADAKHPTSGMVEGLTGANLTAYSRSAFAKFLRQVPDTDGIQFRMHDESGLKPGQEQFEFWRSIFQTVKDVRPKLRCDLRAKGLPDEIIDLALSLELNVRITTKYWAEQMGMPWHPAHINRQNQSDRRHGYADLLRYPQRYKLHWRLWNGGTARVLLWGDPEWVRRFADSTHLYDGDGFEVNEPLATKMASQPHDEPPFELLAPKYRYTDYEFERYWHFFQVFGRIGYNPNTPVEVWSRAFERHFGKDAAPYLERALHRASWILPRIQAYNFPYHRFPMTRGWVEKQRREDLPAYAAAEGSDTQIFMSFDEAAKLSIEGGESAKVHPLQTAEWFARAAADVLAAVGEAEKHTRERRSNEFISTVTDLKVLAHLALYHSRRIHAGLAYAVFKRTREVRELDEAIAEEGRAIQAWEKIVEAAGDVYAENLMMGLASSGLAGHWKDELVELKRDVAQLDIQLRKLIAIDNLHPTLIRKKSTRDDNTPPEVNHRHVSDAPAGKPLTITAEVSDPSGVKWARVLYRGVNQIFDYRELAMHPTGRKDEYRVTIPAEQIDPKWDFMYLIEVMDTRGNGRIYPDPEEETPYIVVRLIR